jgi:hypothetical protein
MDLRAAIELRARRPASLSLEAPPGFVRLFRAETRYPGKGMQAWLVEGLRETGSLAAQGRWFAADPTLLGFYIDDCGPDFRVCFLDVPIERIDDFRVSRIDERIAGRLPREFSKDPENEFFVPTEIAARKCECTSEMLAEIEEARACAVSPAA